MVAMMSGVIAPPLLIGAMCPAATDPSCTTQRLYLLQAAMIVSAIATAIQVSGFRIGPIRIGNGLLSVMGITVTSVAVWQNAITDMMVSQSAAVSILGMMAIDEVGTIEHDGDR